MQRRGHGHRSDPFAEVTAPICDGSRRARSEVVASILRSTAGAEGARGTRVLEIERIERDLTGGHMKRPGRRTSSTERVDDADLVGSSRRRSAEKQSPLRAATDPTYEDIARRAYELYERRGGENGRDWDHWLQAERDLRGSGGDVSS
jgi:Protein of unknown function (DUF2934)